MNAAAREVMRELPDLVIAYGVSDEFRSVSLSNLEIDSLADHLDLVVVLFSIETASCSNGETG